MKKQIHELQQGSDAWHQFRLEHFGASEAAAMLGLSKKTTRSELLRMKHTGIAREFSDWLQEKVLDRGHEVEAMARPLVEGLIGEDLYPVTMSLGKLSASCDGLTADDETAFEHKQFNTALAAAVLRQELPDEYMPQCQQIMLVTGAKRVIFVCSDGTENNFAHMEVLPDAAWQQRIIAGWYQFESDLAGYVPPEIIPAAVAAPIKDLPALDIQIIGNVVTSNLDAWKGVVIARIDGINTDLKTDQDFADAAETVKFLDDGEKRIDLVKKQAQAQASSIDEAFRAMDEIKATMRAKRLELDKLVTARKEAIKTEQVMRGRHELAEYVVDLNARIGKPYMPVIPVDFAAAIKGKRTVSSLIDAVDTLLANKKIEAEQIASRIEANMKTLRELAADHAFLFSDTSVLVLKDTDAVEAIVKSRIAEHKAAEEKRLAAEREKIAAEERAKLEREQAEKAEAERKAAASACIANETNTPREGPAVAGVAAEGGTRATPALGQRETLSGKSGPLLATGGTVAIKQQIGGATRPSDDSIIATLSLHYRVHESKVIEWLLEMDLKSTSERMTMEFAA